MRRKIASFLSLFTLAFLLAIPVLQSPVRGASRTITLAVWEPHAEIARDILQPLIRDYEKLNPSVRVRVQLDVASMEKLILILNSSNPPDVVYFHNAWTGPFLKGKLLAPLPEELFPLDEMRKENLAFDPANVVDDRIYWIPGGVMTSLIFYNRDAWEELGLESKLNTWEDLVIAARKLTRIDTAGKVMSWGINRSFYFWDDLNYQQGGWLYNQQGTGVAIDTPAGYTALKFLADLALSYKVAPSPTLPDSGVPELRSRKLGMCYVWGWQRRQAEALPDLNLGVFMVPTKDGGNLPARARNNYESGYAVPANVSDTQKKEAFKFLRWLYDNEEYQIKLNKFLGRIPSRPSIWSHPEIARDAVLACEARQAPYTVFPGERPAWLDRVLSEMLDSALGGKKPIETALKDAQRQGDAEFKKSPPTWIVERQYRPPSK